jgi:pilus assembly protein Flp/PilA
MKRIITSKRQLGQGMTEYIIIVALIAIGAVGMFTAFGGVIRHQVSAITLGLTNQSAASTEATNAVTDATTAQTGSADKDHNMSNFSQDGGNTFGK